MTEGDVAPEGERVSELEIADARAGEVITREHRGVVEGQRAGAEGGVIADAEPTPADRDTAVEAAGGGERECTRAALRDTATRAGEESGKGDVGVDGQGADGRTEISRAGEGQRTGLHRVAEGDRVGGAEGEVIREDVGGRRGRRQRRRARQHQDLGASGAESKIMADLYRTLGKVRATHVAVVARDDEGVGGVLE